MRKNFGTSCPLVKDASMLLLALAFALTLDVAGTDVVPTSTTTAAAGQLASTNISPTPSVSNDDQGGKNEYLSLIIGVPTGIGICIIGFIGCFIWLGVSAWREHRLHTRTSEYHSGAHTSRTPGTGVTDAIPGTTSNGPASTTFHSDSVAPDPVEATSTM